MAEVVHELRVAFPVGRHFGLELLEKWRGIPSRREADHVEVSAGYAHAVRTEDPFVSDTDDVERHLGTLLRRGEVCPEQVMLVKDASDDGGNTGKIAGFLVPGKQWGRHFDDDVDILASAVGAASEDVDAPGNSRTRLDGSSDSEGLTLGVGHESLLKGAVVSTETLPIGGIMPGEKVYCQYERKKSALSWGSTWGLASLTLSVEGSLFLLARTTVLAILLGRFLERLLLTAGISLRNETLRVRRLGTTVVLLGHFLASWAG